MENKLNIKHLWSNMISSSLHFLIVWFIFMTCGLGCFTSACIALVSYIADVKHGVSSDCNDQRMRAAGEKINELTERVNDLTHKD